MPGSIDLALKSSEPTARCVIERTEDVPDIFWRRLLDELEVEGSRASTRCLVPAEKFLARRPLVRDLCSQYSVALSASIEVRTLLQAVEAERSTLESSMQGSRSPLSREDVEAALTGTRLSRALRDFQYDDIGKLLSLRHGANFSVPGAGKTVVALAVYEAERAADRVRRLLVVGPLSAFEAWHSEIAESFTEPRPRVHTFVVDAPIPPTTEVLLVNYEKLPGYFGRIAAWVAAAPCLVVLDEAHRVKRGRAGAWGSASLDLAWSAERRDVLTGTPAPQHPSDLEALLNFLWPLEGRRLLPPGAFATVPTPTIGQEVAAAIRPLYVRTRKSQLGLKDPDLRVIKVELHGLHRDIYQAVTNQYAGKLQLLRGDRSRLAQMRGIVMYLLEAATNPMLLPVGSSPDDPPVLQHPPAPFADDANLGHLLRDYGRYETPAKFRKLGELIRSSAEDGRKTLIWSYFVRNLELLRHHLARYEPALIHGGVPVVTSDMSDGLSRQAEIERFRSDPGCMVLLANPAAMGEGISLHRTCHDAIYLERTFNAGQYLQSVDRIHRLGLAEDEDTRIIFLVTQDTIDEVVHDRVHEKALRLSQMLEDPDIVTMSLPDEDDLEEIDEGLGRPIDSDADITALFRHLRGE